MSAIPYNAQTAIGNWINALPWWGQLIVFVGNYLFNRGLQRAFPVWYRGYQRYVRDQIDFGTGITGRTGVWGINMNLEAAEVTISPSGIFVAQIAFIQSLRASLRGDRHNWQRRVPRRTGELRRSSFVDGYGSQSLTFGFRAEYAPVVRFRQAIRGKRRVPEALDAYRRSARFRTFIRLAIEAARRAFMLWASRQNASLGARIPGLDQQGISASFGGFAGYPGDSLLAPGSFGHGYFRPPSFAGPIPPPSFGFRTG